MSVEVLNKLGLTAEQVRAAFGTKREKVIIDRKNYLYAHDQRRIRTRLKSYEGFIYARFEEGLHPGTIARLLSVSEEAIRSRLRKAGFFKRVGPGRPPKKICQQDNLPPSREGSKGSSCELQQKA